MNCSSCGHGNRETAKFCEECAAPLARSCASCGTELRAGAKFCDECAHPVDAARPQAAEEAAGAAVVGEPARAPADYTPKHLADKILQSKSALEGERKQVTVLFADVKGSMELAEQTGAEDWHGILDRFFQILADGVHRFEGTVNQYTGDGIMALFGAPISHEDHAQRACFAALALKTALREYADELRRTQGLSFSTRIGINSGSVVVGKIGDDLRMDYTAQGQTVGLAQRMEALAEPGCAYLADATRRLVEGYFDLRPLGDFAVKGVSEAVPVHELKGLGTQRTRLDRSRARGFSRFIGREAELASLKHALEQSRSGRGRVVGVMADAGTGKSRLCDEFIEHCRRNEVRVIAGHCPAHGRSVPFLPVLELLRDVFGIEERDNELEARRKVAGELTLLDTAMQDTLPLLFEFLGIPDPARRASTLGSEARQQQLLAFVRQLVQARSAREPSVTFIDDLHWVDPSSEAFVAELVEIAASTRTLVLVNFRPEYRADWMQQSHYQQIPLDPLGAEEVQQLVAYLLGTHGSLEGLAEHVYARTGGNPFFVEEIVQSLVESGHLEGDRGAYRLTGGIEEVEIPPSVHAVLAARIDRLVERDKRLLQVASVIGRKVSEPLLAQVADLPAPDLAAALANLQRGEFLLQTVLYPEAEYLFKHALTLDVAYDSQLAQPRARLHAAVARATEAHASDRLDEYAGLLAHHWECADEPLTAAHWHVRASRVAGMTQGTELMRHLRRAHSLLDGAAQSEEALSLGAEVLSLLLSTGIRTGQLDDAEQLIERAETLVRASEDPLPKARLEHGIGTHFLFSNRLEEALAHLRNAERFADAADDPDSQVAVRFNLGVCHWFLGSTPEALGRMTAGLELVAKQPGSGTAILGYDSEAALLCFAGLMAAVLGNARRSRTLADRAVERARDRDAASRVLAHSWAAWAAGYSGDLERSLFEGRRAIEAAEHVSASNIRGIAKIGASAGLLVNQRWAEAAELYDRVIAEGPVYQHHIPGRTRALLGMGNAEAAVAAAEGLVGVCTEVGARGWECENRMDLAVALASLPDPPRDRIEQELDRVSEGIEETGYRILRPRIHELRAQLDPNTRERELREALRLYTEMNAPHADRISRELGAPD